MAFQMIPVTCAMSVKGVAESEAIGEFEGRVIAVAVRGSGDPVAEAATSDTTPGDDSASVEAMVGWGTTYFLVADEGKPHPVWVAKSDVEQQSVEGAPALD